MRSIRNLVWFLVGFSFIFAVGIATASTNGDSYIWYRKPNGDWARTPNPAGGTPHNNYRFKHGPIINPEAGGPRIRQNRKLPVPTLPVIEATIIEDTKIPKNTVKTLARSAVRALPYVAMAATAAEIIQTLNDDGIQYKDLQWQKNEDPVVDQQPLGYQWQASGGNGDSGRHATYQSCLNAKKGWYSSMGAAQTALDSCLGMHDGYAVESRREWKHGNSGIAAAAACHAGSTQCSRTVAWRWGSPLGHEWTVTVTRGSMSCPAGYSPMTLDGASYCVNTSCPDGTPPVGGDCWEPATDEDIEDAVDKATDNRQADIVKRLINRDDFSFDLPADTPQTLTPTTSQQNTPPVTTTTTRTNPDSSVDTTVTTSQQEVTIVNEGDTISTTNISTTINNVTTTTTTNNVTNNTTTTTTTQTNPPPPVVNPDPDPDTDPDDQDDEDYSFIDPAFPQVPSLYTQKYPDGIKGVWAAKWPQLQATPFFSGLISMFPSFSSAGGCPQWSIQLTVIPVLADYGVGDLSVPCWLWQVVGLIFITAACFEARRVIMGK